MVCTDTAGEREGAVNGTFRALAGQVFVVINRFTYHAPLHKNGQGGEGRRQCGPDGIDDCRNIDEHNGAEQSKVQNGGN